MRTERIRAAVLAGVVVASAAVVAGCEDGLTGSDPRPGDVSGRVALTKTAAGVPNAVVALLRDGRVTHVAPTDADGRFRFDAVPPGRYLARLTGLELTGVSPLHVAFSPDSQTVEVAGDDADVFFAGLGIVPGRIVGDVRCDGLLREGVAVRVVGGATDTTVLTNAQGRYSATELGAGRYAVLVPAPPAGCEPAPAWAVVRLLQGQEGHADFDG